MRPGRDRRAVRHPAAAGTPRAAERPGKQVLVVGGGIAGLAAAAGLTERGVGVTLVEAERYLGGRAGGWPVTLADGSDATMTRGFHAFFRQYYNLRALLRRADPWLRCLRPLPDYPLVDAEGRVDSFARIPRTPPANLVGFVRRSPTFRLADLTRIDVGTAMALLRVRFPDVYRDWDDLSAAQFLDRMRFPAAARHLALEVFARSFFAPAEDFSAAELLAMFHLYFLGSSEGLVFDVPSTPYPHALWEPLEAWLVGNGAQVRTGARVQALRRDETSTGQVFRAEVGGEELVADAVVLAVDPGALPGLVDASEGLPGGSWRARVTGLATAPPFAVWRLWLDRAVRPDRSGFLATGGRGILDNVSVLERFDDEAARWAAATGGSVVELHAYALRPDDAGDGPGVRRQLRAALDLLYPETVDADVVDERWLVRADCPRFSPGDWSRRPEVRTPDPALVLAGDGIRCDLPVALMERAATTGFQAANALLGSWGVTGVELWSAPTQPRFRVLRGTPARPAAGR